MVKNLFNVVQEGPDNFAEEEIIRIVVLILMGQHCTVENLMEFCPEGFTLRCIRNNPLQLCANTIATKLHRSKPYAIMSERLQKTLHKRK